MVVNISSRDVRCARRDFRRFPAAAMLAAVVLVPKSLRARDPVTMQIGTIYFSPLTTSWVTRTTHSNYLTPAPSDTCPFGQVTANNGLNRSHSGPLSSANEQLDLLGTRSAGVSGQS